MRIMVGLSFFLSFLPDANTAALALSLSLSEAAAAALPMQLDSGLGDGKGREGRPSSLLPFPLHEANGLFLGQGQREETEAWAEERRKEGRKEEARSTHDAEGRRRKSKGPFLYSPSSLSLFSSSSLPLTTDYRSLIASYRPWWRSRLFFCWRQFPSPSSSFRLEM